MRAQPGRIYAQIVEGKLHWLFTSNELPEWNNNQAPAIDVTDVVPAPTIGQRYIDGAFTSALSNEDQKAEALARLMAIDAESVRAMREHLVTLPDAPQKLIEAEQLAIVERTKLRELITIVDEVKP